MIDNLTEREQLFLMLLARGFSNRAIAELVGLSHDRARRYVPIMMEKLGLQRSKDYEPRVQLAVQGIQLWVQWGRPSQQEVIEAWHNTESRGRPAKGQQHE